MASVMSVCVAVPGFTKKSCISIACHFSSKLYHLVPAIPSNRASCTLAPDPFVLSCLSVWYEANISNFRTRNITHSNIKCALQFYTCGQVKCLLHWGISDLWQPIESHFLRHRGIPQWPSATANNSQRASSLPNRNNGHL